MTASKTTALELKDSEFELGSSDNSADPDSSVPASAGTDKTSPAAMKGLLNSPMYHRVDSGVFGMVEQLTGLTSRLTGVHKTLDFLSAYPHLAGITSMAETMADRFGGVASASLAAMRVGNHALGIPSAIEAMAEMNRTVTGLNSFTESLRNLNQIEHATAASLAMNMASEDTWSALIAASATGRQMAGVVALHEYCRDLSHQFERMAHFDSMLSRTMLPDVHGVWSRHLQAIAVPAVDIFAREWSYPMAVLSELPEPGHGATVTWKARRKRKEIIQTAAMTSDVADGDVIVVDAEALCAICGKPLRQLEPELRWLGPKLAIRNQRILPVCLHCEASAGELSLLIQRVVATQQVPKLRVMQGGQSGDGVSRGRGVLRIVRDGDGGA